MSYLFQSQSQTQRNALHFDGVNDIVTLNSYPALNNTNQITIEGWVYATSYPKVIFMMNSSVSLEMWTEGRIMMYFVLFEVSDLFINLSTGFRHSKGKLMRGAYL